MFPKAHTIDSATSCLTIPQTVRTIMQVWDPRAPRKTPMAAAKIPTLLSTQYVYLHCLTRNVT